MELITVKDLSLEPNRPLITDNMFEQFLYMSVMPLCILIVIIVGFLFY